MTFTTTDDVLKYIKDEGIEFLDIRFTDVPGTEHHFTLPASAFDEDAISAGFAFDGSSIRGFTTIDESDMILLPDPTTAFRDPFRSVPTLNMKFFVHDPFTKETFSRDPRNVAKRAEEYLTSTGIADSASFGMEAEFFIFDKVSYAAETNASFYHVDSDEGWWNRGEETLLDGTPNLGNATRPKGGYFPNTPVDKTQEVRDAIVQNLQLVGFDVERFHHEVASGGQNEINYRFDTLLHAADDLQTFKYIVKNTCHQYGKVATFMPKPLAGDNGSGMHAHQSLWKDGEPLFYDESGYGGLSDTARYYIGGLLHHAPAVLAFTNPTLNSYHRLVPGFEAPINLVYSQRNR
ncbi:type I glutamate--ammonia ligase, partial [Corynebacterium sp.]